jgi:HlyD family type I secretion membrane fusion protein
VSASNAPSLPAPAVLGADPPPVRELLTRWRLLGVGAILVWGGLFATWAILAPISGAVVAPGLVKVESNRQIVSHRDGGIVAQILVVEGQTVAKGETLIVLEDARLDTAVDLLQAQLVTEELRKSRLEAEAALRPAWTPPPPALAGDGAAHKRTREALARERSAFEARRRTLDGQLASVRGQLVDTETEIKAHQRNNVAATEAMSLLREEIASNEKLLEENFINRTRVLALRRGLAEYESRIETTAADGSQARQRKAELEGRLEGLRLAYVQQATEELREATARLIDVEERLRAGSDAVGRQVIAAPVAGRLVDLRVNTVGSAVGAREPIVDIVPAGLPLVVESRVGAESITDVRAGQKAEVRLVGTRQRDTPLLDGKVMRVSADALLEPRSGLPYFAVQVEVQPPPVGFPPGLPLIAGQATEVYIKTSERTALEFLLEPLTSGLRRSFREH